MLIKKDKIFRQSSRQAGFSLVELLVAISFVSVIITAILTMNAFTASLWKANEDKTKAYFYATESLEAMKLIGWSSLSNGDYHLVLQNNTWTLISGDETLENKYTRNINISSVQRQFNTSGHVYGDIVASGFADPDSKKISTTITWPDKKGNIKTLSLDNYLSRWQAERFSQTDWFGGSGQATWSDVTKFYSKTSGLETSIEGITTLVSGFLDWNNATPTSTKDLPNSSADANDIYVSGNYAYMVTENNSSGSGGSEFYILNIADPKNPAQVSSLNIGSTATAVVVQGNYAYVSTKRDSSELRIIDISNVLTPSIISNIDLTGSQDASDVAVSGTKLYLVRGNSLYYFNIIDPRYPPQTPLNNIDLGDLGKKLFISANYVYVATEKSNKELQIFDATTAAYVGGADLPDDATDVFVQGARAYVSTDINSGAEFYVFDVSNPSSPALLGSYEVGERVNAISIVGPYALLGLTANQNQNLEIKVIDISFPTTISPVRDFNLDGDVLGLSANCSLVYAATKYDTKELAIISTGMTDCYATDGQLESSTFDTGAASVTYNWLAWSGSQPANTTIKFQLATSNNSNGPWNYVGPDGSGSSYYMTAAKEFINYNYHLDQRYFRYKLFLNSQSDFQAPALEEFILSYSPHQ